MEFSVDSFGSADGDTWVSGGGRAATKTQVAARMAELERQGRLVTSKERTTAAGRRKAALVQGMSQAAKCSKHFRKLEFFRQTQRLTLPAGGEAYARPVSRGDLAIGLAVRAGVTIEQLRRLKGALDCSAPQQNADSVKTGVSHGDGVDENAVAVLVRSHDGARASEAGSADAWVEADAPKNDSSEAARADGSLEWGELAQAVNNRLLTSLAEKVANDASHSSDVRKGGSRAAFARVVDVSERREESQRGPGAKGLCLREGPATLSAKAVRSASFALSTRKHHFSSATDAGSRPDSPVTDYQRHLENIVHERFFAPCKTKATSQHTARSKVTLDEMKRKAVGGRDLGADDAEPFAHFSHWDDWKGSNRGFRAAGAPDNPSQRDIWRTALDGAAAEGLIEPRSAWARHAIREVHGYRTVGHSGRGTGEGLLPKLRPVPPQLPSVYTHSRVVLEQEQLAQLVDDDFYSQVYKHSEHLCTEHQKRKMVYTSIQFARHVSGDALDMRHLGLGDTAAALLANVVQAHLSCAELRRMDLSHNNLSDAGFAALNTVLKAKLLPNLEALALSHNQLTVSSVKLISESVMSFSVRGMAGTLAELDLSHNPIWDEGAIHLCGALGENICRMSRISLAACGLSDLACMAIGAMLSVAIFLKQLDFSWNAIGIGRNDHIAHLGVGIASNASLSSLNLSNCGLHSLACVRAISHGIRHNECLEELILDGNAIDEEGALEIAAALSANSRLRRLSMQHNPVKHGGGVALIAAMLRSPAMELVDLKHCALIDDSAGGVAAERTGAPAAAGFSSSNTAAAGETAVSVESRTGASVQAAASPASWQALARAMLEREPSRLAAASCPLGAPTLSDRRFHLLWQGMDLHTLGYEWTQQYVRALALAAWLPAAQCDAIVADVVHIHGHASAFRSAVQLMPRVPDMWSLLLHRAKAHSAAALQRLLEAHGLPAGRFAIGNPTNSYAFNLGLQSHRTAAQYLFCLNCTWRRRLEIHGLLTRGDARTAGVFTAIRNLEYCAHPRRPFVAKLGDDAPVASRCGESSRGRRSGAGKREPGPWADLTALHDSHIWVSGGLDSAVQLPNCGWLRFDFVSFMGGSQWQVLKSPVHLLGQAPHHPVQWRSIEVFRADAARARSSLLRPPPSPRFASVASRMASQLAVDQPPTPDAKLTAGLVNGTAALGSTLSGIDPSGQSPSTGGLPPLPQAKPSTPAATQSSVRPSSKGSWGVASGAMIALGTATDVPPMTCAPQRPRPVDVRRLMTPQAWIDAANNMSQSAGWCELTRQSWGDLQTKKAWWEVKGTIERSGLDHGLLACVSGTLDQESASTGGLALRAVPDSFASRGADIQASVSVSIDDPNEQADILLATPPEHLAPSLFLQTLLLRVLDELSFTEGEWLPSASYSPRRASSPRPPPAHLPHPIPESSPPANDASVVATPSNSASDARSLPGQSAKALPPPAARRLASSNPVSAMAPTTVGDLRAALAQAAARNWDRACALTREVTERMDRTWEVAALDVPGACEVTRVGDETAHVYLVLAGRGVVSVPVAGSTAMHAYGVAAGDMVGEMAALLWLPPRHGRYQVATGARAAAAVNSSVETQRDNGLDELQLSTVPAGCNFRTVTHMQLLACPVKQVRSLFAVFPALMTRLQACAEVRGAHRIPLPICRQDPAVVARRQPPQRGEIPGAQASSDEAAVAEYVEAPMWRLLPVVCCGDSNKRSKAAKPKQTKARNKNLPRDERIAAGDMALLAASSTQLELCPAPLSAGSPQSTRQPPFAEGGPWKRNESRHAWWMEQSTGRVLEAVRRYGVSCELSVSEIIALLDGNDVKRWLSPARVQLVLALFDSIRLDDLPNICCLLARLSPFEQGLLGHKLGWAALLDPFRGMGVHVSLRLANVQDLATLLRVLKVQRKLDLAAGGAGSAKVRHVRVNGHLLAPLGHGSWPEGIRAQDAMCHLDWAAYLALQQQLRHAAAKKSGKESRGFRVRMAELVAQAKRKSVGFARPSNCVQFELASLTEDEVRDVAAITITGAFRANMRRRRFAKVRHSVLRLQRVCLGMLLRHWERRHQACLGDEEAGLLDGVNQAARSEAAAAKEIGGVQLRLPDSSPQEQADMQAALERSKLTRKPRHPQAPRVDCDDAGQAKRTSKLADAGRQLWHQDCEALTTRAQQLVDRLKGLAWKELCFMAHNFVRRSTEVAKKKLMLSELLYHWTPDLLSQRS